IARRGGIPVSAPALREEPVVDPDAIAELMRDLAQRPPKLAIFHTAVGTRALFGTTDTLQLTRTLTALLAGTLVAARGPKPTAVLRQRSVRIDFSAADPFTTPEVIDAIAGITLANEPVLVQRYGETNEPLNASL